MADPFSIASAAIGVAGAGVKLATTLYTFTQTVRNADKSFHALANDVSITSSVLQELGGLLKKDHAERLCSANALNTASAALKGCQEAFDEVDEALQSTLNSHKSNNRSLPFATKLSWPLKQNKINTLQANLERLKSTLLLMLNVLVYARRLTPESPTTRTELVIEKAQIQTLIKANQDATAKYDQLMKALTLEDNSPRHRQPETAGPQPASTGNPFMSFHLAQPPQQHYSTEEKHVLDSLDRCHSAVHGLLGSLESTIAASRERTRPKQAMQIVHDLHAIAQESKDLRGVLSSQAAHFLRTSDGPLLVRFKRHCSSRLATDADFPTWRPEVGQYKADEGSKAADAALDALTFSLEWYKQDKRLSAHSARGPSGAKVPGLVHHPDSASPLQSPSNLSDPNSAVEDGEESIRRRRACSGGEISSNPFDFRHFMKDEVLRSQEALRSTVGTPSLAPVQAASSTPVVRPAKKANAFAPPQPKKRKAPATDKAATKRSKSIKSTKDNAEPEKASKPPGLDTLQIRIDRKASLRQGSINDLGELILENELASSSNLHPSAMSLALNRQLDNRPISLRSAANSPSSRVASLAPEEQNIYVFELGGSESPESGSSERLEQEELSSPAQVQRHGPSIAQSLRGCDSAGAEHDKDDLDMQLALAMAERSGDSMFDSDFEKDGVEQISQMNHLPQLRNEAESLLRDASQELQRCEAQGEPRPRDKSRPGFSLPTRFGGSSSRRTTQFGTLNQDVGKDFPHDLQHHWSASFDRMQTLPPIPEQPRRRNLKSKEATMSYTEDPSTDYDLYAGSTSPKQGESEEENISRWRPKTNRSPISAASRERSPFREGLPVAPTTEESNIRFARQAVETAPTMQHHLFQGEPPNAASSHQGTTYPPMRVDKEDVEDVYRSRPMKQRNVKGLALSAGKSVELNKEADKTDDMARISSASLNGLDDVPGASGADSGTETSRLEDSASMPPSTTPPPATEARTAEAKPKPASLKLEPAKEVGPAEQATGTASSGTSTQPTSGRSRSLPVLYCSDANALVAGDGNIDEVDRLVMEWTTVYPQMSSV